MDTLQKAKIALRKYLLENREKVAIDLENMRKMSEGNDIFRYVDNMSQAFSFETVTTCQEITYNHSFFKDDHISYKELIESALYSPPDRKETRKPKKDRETNPRSFFFDSIATC